MVKETLPRSLTVDIPSGESIDTTRRKYNKSSILKQQPMAEDINRELVKAVGNGDLERVRSLILQGADVNERDGEAFVSAAEFNYVEILAYLYTQGVEEFPQYEALIAAAGNGSLEAVKFLISVGSIDHDARALRIAALNGYLDVVMFLTSCGYRMDTSADSSGKRS